MVNYSPSLMEIAVKEAWKYQGLTYPNPAVGALISDDFGSILSCKAHVKARNPHGEVEVIKDAFIKLTNDKNLILLTDSADIHKYLLKNHNNIFNNYTLYVTLEPCNHYGKTPPCSHLIKELGFKKVIIGTLDLNKKASGGAEFLSNNAIQVEILQKNPSCFYM
ncbi:MAG: riboflavin biosynthesis protein RibD, partial [Epsilonproteobacteria bacterium]|nr:riboflavin biosynthesis protein RibD [Campylobacterota bacterium]